MGIGSAPDDDARPFDTGLPDNPLTPMGQVDATGAFARGLGARRVKIAIFGAGGLVLLVGLATLVL